MPGFFSEVPFNQTYDANAEPFSRLNSLDPIKGASVFAGMLLDPSLQSNCVRLEALAHIILHRGTGRQKLNAKLAGKLFQAMNDTSHSLLEDPAEDVFVSCVRTKHGNFRILEGIWEGNAFYLQRFLNVLDQIPSRSDYDQLKRSVLALLSLSDVVLERAGLDRFQLGAEDPLSCLKRSHLAGISSYRSRVRIGLNELQHFGVAARDLAPFLFDMSLQARIGEQHPGSSLLEQKPLIQDGDYLYFILPTAAGVAIRLFVISQLASSGMSDVLVRALGSEYSELLSRTPLLGESFGRNFRFQKVDGYTATAATAKIDEGRYLNIICVVDGLDGVVDEGLAGGDPASVYYDEFLLKWIGLSSRAVPEDPNFKSCICLLIHCGIGRGFAFGMPDLEREGWELEVLSAYDFFTLCWASKITPLTLWRIFETQKKLEHLGVQLANLNGFLNLFSWTRELNSHLVPHGLLPSEFAADQPSVLVIDQTSQRKLRHAIAVRHDPRVVQDVDGVWRKVRKNPNSDLREDKSEPLYMTDGVTGGFPRSIYLADRRAWWAEIAANEDALLSNVYERGRLVALWLSRSAPILDPMPDLPEGPINWATVFVLPDAQSFDAYDQVTYEDVKRSITVTVDIKKSTVQTECTALFEKAFFHNENIAERALVDAFVTGVLELANRSITEKQSLLSSIVSNFQARHGHAFLAQDFRSHVQSDLSRDVILIDPYDDASFRIGLGWRDRSREEGERILGKKECTSFLNDLVRNLQNDLIERVRLYDRRSILEMLIRNYEAAVLEREHWNRTSGAIIALRKDKYAARTWIADHEMRLNVLFQATRILVEVAACEAPVENGELAGELELSQLMALASSLFFNGGFSDAIRWDVMKAEILITPLGDIHANYDFVDHIITPHGYDASNVRIDDAIAHYSDNLKDTEHHPSVRAKIDPEFWEAWEAQIGANLDQTRVFVDYFENRGISHNSGLFEIRRSELDAIEINGIKLPSASVEALLRSFVLPLRHSYGELPTGFSLRDLRPWLFRRDLSFLRRPFVQLPSDGDPTFLLAPGMLRDAFGYLLRNYQDGSFPEEQLCPEMRSWKHRVEGARGTIFALEVAAKLKSQGWQTEEEIKLTKIFGQRLERDFGDIDVLAWSVTTNRVLVIECKDVQYRKTFGEIAEQLSDFRGGLRENGKPDYLRRHLDRVDKLRECIAKLSTYIGLDANLEIESHLVFRNPVPMEHALKGMANKVAVWNFSDIVSLNP